MSTSSKSLVPCLPIVLVATLVSGCGVKLQDKKPSSPTGVMQTLERSPERRLYSADDTYKSNPEYWLGRVGVARKQGGTCSDQAAVQVEWQTKPVRYVPTDGSPTDPSSHLGYKLGVKNTESELRGSEIITRQLAASLRALDYLSAHFQGEMVFEVILTDVANQRIEPSSEYEVAIDAWKEANGSLIENEDICWIFVVEGYTHKTLVRKGYTKFEGQAKGGYAGIQVEGSYYEGQDTYTLDHLFGLSVGILHRGADVNRIETGGPGERKATDEELQVLELVELPPPPDET